MYRHTDMSVSAIVSGNHHHYVRNFQKFLVMDMDIAEDASEDCRTTQYVLYSTGP
jgi:hypothetical protein